MHSIAYSIAYDLGGPPFLRAEPRDTCVQQGPQRSQEPAKADHFSNRPTAPAFTCSGGHSQGLHDGKATCNEACTWVVHGLLRFFCAPRGVFFMPPDVYNCRQGNSKMVAQYFHIFCFVGWLMPSMPIWGFYHDCQCHKVCRAGFHTCFWPQDPIDVLKIGRSCSEGLRWVAQGAFVAPIAELQKDCESSEVLNDRNRTRATHGRDEILLLGRDFLHGKCVMMLL